MGRRRTGTAGLRRRECDRSNCGRSGGSGGGERAENGGVRDATVVKTIAAAQHGAAGAGDVPGEADAGAEIVAVVGEVGGLGDVGIGYELVGVGQALVVVADAERQGEARGELPVVGEESGVVGGLEIPDGGANGLTEPGVAGIVARAGGGSVATVGGEKIRGEVGERGVGIFAVLVGDSIDAVGDVVVVVTEAEGVAVVDPGDGVDELLASLERVLGFIFRREGSEGKAGGGVDGDLRGAAVNVGGKLLLEGRGRGSELREQVAAVLVAGVREDAGSEEVFKRGNGGVFAGAAVAEAADAVSGGSSGEDAVGGIAAHEVVFAGQMDAAVDAPVDFGEEDYLAGGARDIAEDAVELVEDGFVSAGGLRVEVDGRGGAVGVDGIGAGRDAGGERLDGLCGGWGEEGFRLAGAGDGGVIAVVIVGGEEPEELVAADGASGVEAELKAAVGGFVGLVDVGDGLAVEVLDGRSGGSDCGSDRLGLHDAGEGVGGPPGGVAISEGESRVESVAAGAGDGVDDASGGAAIFGGEVGSADAELADGTAGGGISTAHGSALASAEGDGVVDAVERDSVHQRAEAAKGEGGGSGGVGG